MRTFLVNCQEDDHCQKFFGVIFVRDVAFEPRPECDTITSVPTHQVPARTRPSV